MHNLFTRTRPSTRPLLSAEDIDQILNTFDKAALLVDKKSHKIVSVNPKLMELTAYTHDELVSMSLEDILGGQADILLAMRSSPPEANLPRVKLFTRNQQNIEVAARTQPLSENTPWALLTFEAVDLRKFKKAKETLVADLLDHLFLELASTLQNTNPEKALDRVLEIGHKLLPDSTLAIYIGRPHKPGAQKISATGELDKIFPSEISPLDIKHLVQPSIWQRGQRSIVTILHQAARSEGFAFLASTPIASTLSATNGAEQDQQAWLGTIVAGSKSPPPENTLQCINILAEFACAIINNNILLTNLRRQLAENKSLLRIWDAVRENAKDGIITVTPNMDIQAVNPSAELILGYASTEIIGLPIDSVVIGTNRLMPALRRALKGIPTPSLGNIHLHRRDGSSFAADLEINPIGNHEATVGGLIFIRDLSENEQIRLRSQQLEQRALLGEVTAVFAHEVRNPINNINMGLQLLERALEKDDPDRERIQNMQEDCQRLTTLMDSVLTFSRTGNYVFTPLNLEELLQQIFKRWRPRFAKVDIHSHIQAQSDLPDVLGDQRSLEQVFTNLISNSVNAMKESGGTFAVKLSQANHPSGKAIIHIDLLDSGPGIPQENQERIFDPFFTTNPNGTGLGLSITKQIITAHKGTITLTSFPGGTTFHIQLPAVDDGSVGLQEINTE